jgi:ADP-ribosylglycohydrolase
MMHNNNDRSALAHRASQDRKAVLIDRAKAAMVALGVGDASGDLGRDAQLRQQYGIINRLLPEGKSTDDTEFSVLSARALLSCPGDYTAQHVADTWRRLVIDKGGALDRGGTPLYGALWNLAQGIQPPYSGIDNTLNNDDGAAMRAVPFGIAAVGHPAEAARLAAIDASVSHDRDGIWAAQAIAASISVALEGAPVEEVIRTGRHWIPQDSWLGRRMVVMDGIFQDLADPFDQYEALHTRLWTPRHAIAAEAIPQVYALYQMSTGNFRKAFLLSANFGRDADTICALVLALCAAGQGLAVIPDAWVEQVRRPSGVCLAFTVQEDLLELGKELLLHALERGAQPTSEHSHVCESDISRRTE